MWYLLCVFGGVIVGAVLMGLMASSSQAEIAAKHAEEKNKLHGEIQALLSSKSDLSADVRKNRNVLREVRTILEKFHNERRSTPLSREIQKVAAIPDAVSTKEG